MPDNLKPLSLHELIAQGAYENNERKWTEAVISYKGTEYNGLKDDKGFFYGPDRTLYHTKNGNYDDGGLFTGISYELYPGGALELYQVYEDSKAVETYRFYKNGNLMLYRHLRGLLEFDEDGILIKKNGKPVRK